MAPNDLIYSEKITSPKLASETDSSNAEVGGVAQEKSLHRQLKNRHVAMIRCISFKVYFFFFNLMHTASAVSSELACSWVLRILYRLVVPSVFCLAILSLGLYVIALWYIPPPLLF